MPAVPSSSQAVPNFTELVTLLQNAAQALSTFCPPQTAGPRAEKPLGHAKVGEIRCFEIPAFTCNDERQLLEQLQADTWQEMFYKVYAQLYTFARLLEQFGVDEQVDGVFMQHLGMTLRGPLALMSRLCSVVADFKLLPQAAAAG